MWKKVLILAILALIYPIIESRKKKSGEYFIILRFLLPSSCGDIFVLIALTDEYFPC